MGLRCDHIVPKNKAKISITVYEYWYSKSDKKYTSTCFCAVMFRVNAYQIKLHSRRAIMSYIKEQQHIVSIQNINAFWYLTGDKWFGTLRFVDWWFWLWYYEQNWNVWTAFNCKLQNRKSDPIMIVASILLWYKLWASAYAIYIPEILLNFFTACLLLHWKAICFTGLTEQPSFRLFETPWES